MAQADLPNILCNVVRYLFNMPMSCSLPSREDQLSTPGSTLYHQQVFPFKDGVDGHCFS